VRRLLWSHSTTRDRRRTGRFVEDDHRGVETGHLERGVEHAVEQLVELDRAAELAEKAIPTALALGSVECIGEVATEIVHSRPHVVDRDHEPVVPRIAGASGTTRSDDDYRRQANRRRKYYAKNYAA
jgi:hypothetical protein